MCGLTGTIKIGDLSLVEQMTELMAYRGPDDFGLFEDGEVRLGHRRLSILDLSAARMALVRRVRLLTLAPE